MCSLRLTALRETSSRLARLSFSTALPSAPTTICPSKDAATDAREPPLPSASTSKLKVTFCTPPTPVPEIDMREGARYSSTVQVIVLAIPSIVVMTSATLSPSLNVSGTSPSTLCGSSATAHSPGRCRDRLPYALGRALGSRPWARPPPPSVPLLGCPLVCGHDSPVPPSPSMLCWRAALDIGRLASACDPPRSCQGQLGALRETGGTERVALGDQATGGVDARSARHTWSLSAPRRVAALHPLSHSSSAS